MDSFPMIVRSTLGQGGVDGFLKEQADYARHARAVFGSDSAVAAEVEPPITHSVLAAWALNLPVNVVKDLAEPTRKEMGG